MTTPNTIAGSTQSWALDAVGNQTSTTTGGTTVAKTQNSKNQLTGVGSSTLAYDNNGNTTTDENGNTLTYDAWNRMVTDSAGGTSYTFDANDRRITETHGSTTTDLYFTTQGQVIEERVAGTVTSQNVWSIDYVNDLLLRDDNSTSGNLGISGSGLGNRDYYQHDANYNVTAMVDNGGNVIQRYVYSPYGVQTVLDNTWAVATGVANSIYGFQGGRYDAATGLYRFGARDYNPNTGTWSEADGGYWDGAELYQAMDNSPVDKVDPFGTAAWEVDPNAKYDEETIKKIKLQIVEETKLIIKNKEKYDCADVAYTALIRSTAKFKLKIRLTYGSGNNRGAFDSTDPKWKNQAEFEKAVRDGLGSINLWENTKKQSLDLKPAYSCRIQAIILN